MSNLAIKKGSAALPSSGLPADVERVMAEINSYFNPLHNDRLVDFHVSGVRDGYVYLSLALPQGMTRVFAGLLESLHGFFKLMDFKARSRAALDKPVDTAELLRQEKDHEAFVLEVCTVFDDLIRSGKTRNEAVKGANLLLKARNHPWATYDIVQGVLRANGRLRKNRAVHRQEPGV